MTDQIYTAADSLEVRKAFYEAKKNSVNPPKRRHVITEKEWGVFEKRGEDMSQYITLQTLRKEERSRQMQQMKERTKK